MPDLQAHAIGTRLQLHTFKSDRSLEPLCSEACPSIHSVMFVPHPAVTGSVCLRISLSAGTDSIDLN